MDKLYQKELLALANIAKNAKPIENATHIAEVNNPVCGDRITASITLEDDVITQAYIRSRGCALCEAGAGLWLKSCVGHSLHDLENIGASLHAWLQDDSQLCPLEKAAPLEPVRAIKNRHKCITLAFQTSPAFMPI